MMRLLLLLPCLLVAPPAGAVLLDRPDGSANTTAPPDDPGFAHVANVQGLSGVYLGHGWILSAAHVAPGPAQIGGVSYAAVDGTWVQLQAEGSATLPPDLAVWRLAKPWPALPSLPIRQAPLALTDSLVMIGAGAERTGLTTWMSTPGYTWSGAHAVRWGTNAVEGFPTPDPFVFVASTNTETHAFYSRFNCTCTASGDDEAIAVNGDSGGAVFIENGGEWQLGGILFAMSVAPGQPAGTVMAPVVIDGELYFNLSWAADLSVYRDQILELTAPSIPALFAWGVPCLAALLAGAAGLAARRAHPGGPGRKPPAAGADPR